MRVARAQHTNIHLHNNFRVKLLKRVYKMRKLES